MKSTKWNRQRLLRRSAANAEASLRDEVWLGALKEVELGWLTGPHSHEDLCNRLGPLYVVSRRFGLKQSDKTRAIDDLSEPMINAAYCASYIQVRSWGD